MYVMNALKDKILKMIYDDNIFDLHVRIVYLITHLYDNN